MGAFTQRILEMHVAIGVQIETSDIAQIFGAPGAVGEHLRTGLACPIEAAYRGTCHADVHSGQSPVLLLAEKPCQRPGFGTPGNAGAGRSDAIELGRRTQHHDIGCLATHHRPAGRIGSEVDIGLVDHESRSGMRGGDRDESIGIEMCAGWVVRVGNDDCASGIHRRIDLLERRGLVTGAAESVAGEGFQVVGVGRHRHLNRGVIEFAAHRPR